MIAARSRTWRACAMLAAATAGCSRGSEGSGATPKRELRFPVEVAPVEARRVEYAVPAVGSVTPFEVVQITARVAGVVERVRFLEGDAVRAGALLVEIEPERHRLAAEAARAARDRAEATRAEAEGGLARRERAEAASPGLIAGEQLDEARTRARAAAADAAQARAALARAELDLRDAIVRAPASGVVESRSVQTGQRVEPGTVLATLVRRDPLLLRFDVPEQDAVRLRVGQRAFFAVRGIEGEHAAEITHVGTAADERSRMVAVVARVEAAAGLRPGAFAEIRVPVAAADAVPVVPQTAVRPSERGFIAFVVEAELAHERVLTLGLRTRDGHVEVRSGLRPGEPLVVRGAEALRDGAPVRVVPPAAERGTSAPAPSNAASP